MDECRRLKGIYKAKAKVDLESFYSNIANEAEEGFQRNNIRPAYRAIKRLRGGPHGACKNITVLDGTLCTTLEETADRWMEHYQTALNHPPAITSTDLDNFALAASPDLEISENAPTISDISRSI